MVNKRVFSVKGYEEYALSVGGVIDIIGYSENNYPIKVIKKGNGKIKILFIARIHGNEPAPTQALLDFFNEMNPHDVELYGIFLANPDGAILYEKLWLKNQEAYWENNFNDARLNANGIDLNRDWLDLSQKETQAIQKYIIKLKPDFVADLHEYYWSDKGYPPKFPTDDENGFMSTMTDAPYFGVDKHTHDISKSSMDYLIVNLEKEFDWKIKTRHFVGSPGQNFGNPSFIGIYLALRGIPKLLIETWGVACSTLLLEKRIQFHKKALILLTEWITDNENLFINRPDSIVPLEFDLKDFEKSEIELFIRRLNMHFIQYKLNEKNLLITNNSIHDKGFINTIYHLTFNLEK